MIKNLLNDIGLKEIRVLSFFIFMSNITYKNNAFTNIFYPFKSFKNNNIKSFLFKKKAKFLFLFIIDNIIYKKTNNIFRDMKKNKPYNSNRSTSSPLFSNLV